MKIPFPPLGYITLFCDKDLQVKLLISNGEKFVAFKELKDTHPEYYEKFIKHLNVEDDKAAEEMFWRGINSYIAHQI